MTLSIVGRRVTSTRRIEQSPLSDDPSVPRGAAGNVEDWDSCSDLYAVDFGGPYGVVLCCAEDIVETTHIPTKAGAEAVARTEDCEVVELVSREDHERVLVK